MKTAITLALTLASLAACNSSGDGFIGEYRVNDVDFIADDIEIGEAVRVTIFFETAVDLDGESDAIEVIAQVSPDLAYRPGSSEIYDGNLDDDDDLTPDEIRICPDGRTFLIYNLSEGDLSGRSIGGSDFAIKFEVLGRRRTPVARVDASADESQDVSCLFEFDSEESESVEVL